MSCGGDVDHFIPWSRYPDNGIDNLVVADQRCNSAKSDFLAGPRHVMNWRTRNVKETAALAQMAEQRRWETHPEETLGVARGLYLRLPQGARLWTNRREFCRVTSSELRESLA